MANNKKSDLHEDNFEQVEGALTRSEEFIEKNQKTIIAVIGAVVLVVIGYMAYNNYIVEPKSKAAIIEIAEAQYYFDVDSFSLALDGDGTNLGFLDIIEEYSSTPTGNLAYYYAGVCYARLGQFEKAIDYLNNFKSDDINLAPVAIGLKGDCYLEMGNPKAALKAYKKAYAYKNTLTAPIYLLKAGVVFEKEGNYQEALDAYNNIKDNYGSTNEGRIIDKQIARAKANL